MEIRQERLENCLQGTSRAFQDREQKYKQQDDEYLQVLKGVQNSEPYVMPDFPKMRVFED